MKIIKRLRLKPIHIVALLVLLGVVLLIASKRLSHTHQDTGSSDVVGVDGWGYLGDLEEPFDQFSNRPGQVKASDGEFDTVEFKLFENAETKILKIGKGRLHSCPPEQEGVDGTFTGTIRVWKGNERTPLNNQRDHYAEIGDFVTVEIKNFDRWLFMQFDHGRLSEDLEYAPEKLKQFVKEAVAARRSGELLTGIQEVNWLLRVDLRSKSKDEKAQAWEKLIDVIENNNSLKQIKEANPETVAIKKGSENLTVENINQLEKQFLPLKVWSEQVTELHFKQLTLTINGVMLSGVTPRNSYNEAEAVRKARPSFPLDLYQWARFELERKEVHPKATDKMNELAKANESAWLQLVGKPAFRLPCNLTLRLPEAGLELPTKMIVDAGNEDCRFYLIGIQRWKFLLTVVVFCAILVFLSWLARTTDILRDSSGRIRPDGIEPVSLGKTQMAFWFILTACAYAFLWITTTRTDTINETCLILLGIGSGTALGAAFISGSTGARKYLVTSSPDKSRDDINDDIMDAIVVRLKKLSNVAGSQDPDTRKDLVGLLRQLEHEGNQAKSDSLHYASSIDRLVSLRRKLQDEWGLPEETTETGTREDIVDAISALARKLTQASEGGTPELGGQTEQAGEVKVLAEELELLGAQQAEFKNMADTAWKRLFNDWLSEGPAGKYSFHRFQMLAWTMLLGFIFVAKVLDDRAMPEFSPMTLALLGISAGTYLGFKLPAGGKEEVPSKA